MVIAGYFRWIQTMRGTVTCEKDCVEHHQFVMSSHNRQVVEAYTDNLAKEHPLTEDEYAMALSELETKYPAPSSAALQPETKEPSR